MEYKQKKKEKATTEIKKKVATRKKSKKRSSKNMNKRRCACKQASEREKMQNIFIISLEKTSMLQYFAGLTRISKTLII